MKKKGRLPHWDQQPDRLSGVVVAAYNGRNSLPTQGARRAMDLAVTELPARLQRGERLLGLDPGSKTIGVAVSDSALKVASPLMTLKRGKFGEDAAQLAALCRDYRIGGLVLGLPRNLEIGRASCRDRVCQYV